MARERIYSSGECIGPYEVTRTMATGGMGIVYEARPSAELRGDLLRMGIDRVAVKVARLGAQELDRHERKVLMERIDREFRTLLGLTRLGHPHVVSVFDWGWEDAVPYYVMEVVDGVTFGEALAARPRVGQATHLFAQLCGAVAFLHHGGICHRDLKPSNVMVRAADGEPVLIDFGICLPPTERTLTGPGELLGTPAYLSPEYAAYLSNPDQTRPYLAAPTDDVWALGVMLYELLTGELPWRTPPRLRERLLREIQTVRPPHPSEVYSRAPRAFGDVAMQMLELNPALRPGACFKVVTLLGQAGEKSDVLSPLPPRRSGSRGLTSDDVPTERVPELMGPQRGHIAAGMAVAMLAGFVLFVAGGVSVMTGLWEIGARQAPRGDTQASVKAATEVSGLLKQALPMPKGALPGQRSSPCPASADEINGNCWWKHSLTPAQVEDGVCDDAQLYEPSEGWCRANRTGYRPMYGTRKRGNSVDPK